MEFSKLKKIIITAVCLALCIVLPMIFHSIPNGGVIFSPMHIPVLFCGLVCGFQYGLVCGLIGPLFSSILTGMPPTAFLGPMMIELALYGLITGLMMKLIKTKNLTADLYISLITAMILGRVTTGITAYLFFMKGDYGISTWFTSYFLMGLPGIVVHLILIPVVYVTLMKANLIPVRYPEKSKEQSALL